MDAAKRLRTALAGTPLAEPFDVRAEPFLARRGGDAALAKLSDRQLRGLSRLLGSSGEAARYLSHRPVVLERLASAGTRALDQRAAELEEPEACDEITDLERFLDELRLRRRDEECLAACLDLGGAEPFGEVSRFLSLVAEWTLRRGLAAAHGVNGARGLAVVGMGKIAGRELSYRSDLDLIFLCDENGAPIQQSSRIAQRLISYLTTMTGAGVAYAIDSRLRPSGRQGTLVTTLPAFERYQRERAASWEHLALLRARAIAGDVDAAQAALDRARERAVGVGPAVWSEVAQTRSRVLRERGTSRTGEIAIKTGRGGLMEVEFLATGGLLEVGKLAGVGPLPEIPAMLRAAAEGPGADALLAHYAWLRRVEARTRWLAGRAVETLDASAETLPSVAELVEPGLSAAGLQERLAEAQKGVRSAWERVSRAETIAAL